jgi:transposase
VLNAASGGGVKPRRPKANTDIFSRPAKLFGRWRYSWGMDHGSSELLRRLEALEERTQALLTLVAQKDRLLAEQTAVIAIQQQQLAEQETALQRAHEQLTLFKKALFGPRRERYVPGPDQRLLFEALPLDAEQTASAAATEPNRARPRRKPRRKFVFPDFLPVRREEHPLPADQLACSGCGRQRIVIRTHTTKQLELEQARGYIVEHVRHTYACPGCRQGSQISTTSKPPQPIEKSPFGASVLAWITSAKFERHLPTYRHQEMLIGPLGVWLSRPLLWKLLSGTALCLKPLVEWLKQEILQSFVLQADETPVRYLGGEPGKSALGYLFGYAGDAEHRFLVYDFQPNRSRAGPRAMLANFRGVLQTDGYSAYESLVKECGGRLIPAGCWMHTRRGFDEALATTSHPLVAQSLARIQVLYDLDEQTKRLPFHERRAVHEHRSRPLIEQLFTSWDEAFPVLRPSTKLAEAIGYALNRRAELLRFLDDGRIPLDTGHLERSLRPVAVGRKNYLFFGSLRGGQTAATLYSVVQSARLYHLDVTAYVTDLLRRLPAIPPTETAAVRPLLPDQWALAHPEHVLASREDELKSAAARRSHSRARRRQITTG